MSKASRDKGKRGERLVIDWLQPIVDEVAQELGVKPPLLQRNTIQSDKGGSDIHGLDWLAAEVKNCETQSPGLMDNWWAQTLEQALEHRDALGMARTPILFYTKARSPIRVRMIGCLWHKDAQSADANFWLSCLVDISECDFEFYFRKRVTGELNKRIR